VDRVARQEGAIDGFDAAQLHGAAVGQVDALDDAAAQQHPAPRRQQGGHQQAVVGARGTPASDEEA
jgi:hypothetical protein